MRQGLAACLWLLCASCSRLELLVSPCNTSVVESRTWQPSVLPETYNLTYPYVAPKFEGHERDVIVQLYYCFNITAV